MVHPKCHHCGRRVGRSGFSSIRIARTGERWSYCSRRACRIACYMKSPGADPVPPRSSSEAYGVALFAADLVRLPWWARLAPRAEQDRVRSAFARSIADAVEQHVTSNLTATEGD